MNFVIYTPHFNENIGGVIVLYELGATLQRLGQNVKLWNYTIPHPYEFSHSHNNSKNVENFKIPIGLGLVDRDCPYHFQHARPEDIIDSIVIYSDSVLGNPLNATRVIRWFLYYPGWKSEVMSIGRNDLIYFFLQKYRPKFIDAKYGRILNIHAIRSDIYSNAHGEDTKLGSAYIMHKGMDLPPTYHPADSIPLDGLNHREIANIMQRVKTVYSYDRDTTYNLYALLMGCDVVITNNAYGEKTDIDASHGHVKIISRALAEGPDDLERSREFKDEAAKEIIELNNRNLQNVQNLIDDCSQFWQ